MGRVLLAGIVGGIIIFIWGAVSHMALPLGEMGIHTNAVPGEPAVLTAMKAGLPETGLYMMPGMDQSITDPTAQMEDVMAKWEAGPTAFLVYHAEGAPMMEAKTLVLEGASNILGALIAAMILASMAVGYGARVILVRSWAYSHGLPSMLRIGSGTDSPMTSPSQPESCTPSAGSPPVSLWPPSSKAPHLLALDRSFIITQHPNPIHIF